MISWLLDSPHWVRALIGLALLGVSTLLYFGGTIWPWGWVVGGIILLAAIPSGGQKSRF